MNLLDTMIGSYWVAEYSSQQDAFNNTTFRQSAKANRGMITNGPQNDYLIFGIYRTHEEASAACDEMRKIREGKKKVE